LAEILFTAYAEDCIVHGRLDVSGGRLTDFLNDRDHVTLRDVVMVSHDDRRIVEGAELVIAMSEIYAVEADSRRGNREQRLRTLASPMDINLGPYRVSGNVHAPPTAEPLGSILRRAPMVPATLATIAFKQAGEMRTRTFETLILNRSLMSSVRMAAHVSRNAFGVPAADRRVLGD
jgi:hypothetical protein